MWESIKKDFKEALNSF